MQVLSASLRKGFAMNGKEALPRRICSHRETDQTKREYNSALLDGRFSCQRFLLCQH